MIMRDDNIWNGETLLSINDNACKCTRFIQTAKGNKHFLHFWAIHSSYSTLGKRTGKLDEAVNRELNITRSWNLIQTVDLAWFIPRMIFMLICILYDFKAPLFENR